MRPFFCLLLLGLQYLLSTATATASLLLLLLFGYMIPSCSAFLPLVVPLKMNHGGLNSNSNASGNGNDSLETKPSSSSSSSSSSSVKPEVPARTFIEIMNPLLQSDHRKNSPFEKLPSSLVSHWSTYLLEFHEEDSNNNNNNNNNNNEQQQQQSTYKWMKIPDENDTNNVNNENNDGGFVSPASIDELWVPQDLQLPFYRVCLGLHVRNGMIRHVLPALDMFMMTTTTTRTTKSMAHWSGIGIPKTNAIALEVSYTHTHSSSSIIVVSVQ